jgi:hypothetical protein
MKKIRILLFRLWLPEFLGIWESVCNNPDWEQVNFFKKFSAIIIDDLF